MQNSVRPTQAKLALRRPRPDLLGLLVTALTLIAALALIAPTLALVFKSLISDASGALGLDNYHRVLEARRLPSVIWNTVVLGVGSVAVMFVIATPLAWLYARTDFHWRGAIMIGATCQLATPGFLVALGYLFLLNPSNGLINQWWRALTGGTDPLMNVYSMTAIVLLQGLSMVGPAFYFLAPALSHVDGALEEAASAHGLGKWKTFVFILLPITLPTLLSTALFFLVIAVETFDFAGMLGMPARISVVATWIYQFTQASFAAPEYGAASAIGVMTAIVLLALMVVQGLVFRRSFAIATLGGKSRSASVILSRGAQRAAKLMFCTFLALGFAVPFAMLVWTALLPVQQPPSWAALQSISLDGFGPQFWAELRNIGGATLVLALVVPTLVVSLTSAMAWTATLNRKAARIIEVAVVSCLAVPSIVIAIMFLVGALSLHAYLPIYGSIVVLILAIGTRYLATAFRITQNAFAQVDPELIQAARTLGVPSGITLTGIMVPMLRASLIFAWFWVALLTLRELPITLVLSTYDLQTLASRIFLYNSSGETQQAAALSLALFAIVAVFLVGFFRFVRFTR